MRVKILTITIVDYFWHIELFGKIQGMSDKIKVALLRPTNTTNEQTS